MEILRTGEQARYPWPEDLYLQGGKHGLVLTESGNDYTTAFVEAFPDRTFIRGEGKTVAEAEDAAWAQYQRMVHCPKHPEHGPFERRQYRNGAGFCTECGGWFHNVLPELPPDPNRKPSRLERELTALYEAMTEADSDD